MDMPGRKNKPCFACSAYSVTYLLLVATDVGTHARGAQPIDGEVLSHSIIPDSLAGKSAAVQYKAQLQSRIKRKLGTSYSILPSYLDKVTQRLLLGTT